MRVDYTKEVVMQREAARVFKALKKKKMIEINIFDGYRDVLMDLHPDIKIIIEEKFKQLMDQYNENLHDMTAAVEKLEIKIIKFERLCDIGNVFIDIREMTPKNVVDRLAIVSDKPIDIWNAIEDCFHEGFFNEIIIQ